MVDEQQAPSARSSDQHILPFNLTGGNPDNPTFEYTQSLTRTLSHYLHHPDEPPRRTAKLLTQVNNPNKDKLADHCWLLFHVLLGAALDVPAFHPAQQRLITLIQTIQHEPAPECKGPSFWCQLPHILGLLHEWRCQYWALEPIGSDDIDSEPVFTAAEILNLSTFKALWCAAPPPNHSRGNYTHVGPSWGLWQICLTLEVPRSPEALAKNVPGVAVWFMIAGDKLRTLCRDNAECGFSRARAPFRPDELYKGPDSWNADRWTFWRQRLDDISKDNQLDAETRQWAARGFGAMAPIDCSAKSPKPVITVPEERGNRALKTNRFALLMDLEPS